MESKEFDKEYHLGQIITKRKIIRETLWDLSLSISHNTVGLLYMGVDSPENMLRLYCACSMLEVIGKLVYRGKECYRKMDEKIYDEWLFECHTGEKCEIRTVLERCVETGSGDITDEDVNKVYDKYKVLRAIWGRFLSNRYEIADAGEYAYALTYVRDHDNIPVPRYSDECSLFPNNYKDFTCWDGTGEYFYTILDGF